MAYCRFGSDDFQCDVYCYASYGGFTIHIARTRYVLKGPLPPEIPWPAPDATEAERAAWAQAYLDRHRELMEMLDADNMEAINLPHAGEGFVVETAEEAADKLEYLRDLGYRVPQQAIDALREEAAEDKE